MCSSRINGSDTWVRCCFLMRATTSTSSSSTASRQTSTAAPSSYRLGEWQLWRCNKRAGADTAFLVRWDAKSICDWKILRTRPSYLAPRRFLAMMWGARDRLGRYLFIAIVRASVNHLWKSWCSLYFITCFTVSRKKKTWPWNPVIRCERIILCRKCMPCWFRIC